MIALLINIPISIAIGFIAGRKALSFEVPSPESKRKISPKLLSGARKKIPEISAVIYLITTSFFLYKISFSPDYELSTFITIIAFYTLLAFLLYFAVTDIVSCEIPTIPALSCLAGIVLINILLLLVFGSHSQYELWPGNTFDPASNLLAGFFFTAVTAGIVIITKQRGMGAADIIFAGILGFTNGFPKSITAIYISIFSALLFGIFIALRTKKFKGTRIPFVPFLVLGTITALLIGDAIPFMNFM